MNPGVVLRVFAVALLISLASRCLETSHASETRIARSDGCSNSFPLPNASEIGVGKFEKLLHAFLEKGCYQQWISDAQIRNSGPFIAGKSFGTHNAVKIYYSPQVWDWLKYKNRQGQIPDGAMIVKEMYPSPAKEGLKLSGWTTMVKDKKGSYDGWLWSYHAPGYAPSNPEIDYPDTGFGLYCLRCHASAEKESTFITLKNVEGDPVSFVIQAPTMEPQPPPTKDFHEQVASTRQIIGGPFPLARKTADENLFTLLRELPRVKEDEVKRFPGESFDHVITGADGPTGFLTSSQCMGCHSASNENMGFRFKGDAKPSNLSPYTEWHASMMGLSGRDPIFHAQLESEVTLYPSQKGFLEDTCYRCHGVMGQRQINLDKQQPFKHSMVYAHPDEANGKYGALARDGVSCASCHRVAPDGLGKPESFTGNFKLDAANVVNGPYDQVATLPMKHAMNITPRYGEQIKSSALCGSCHTVVLPVFDRQGKPVRNKTGKQKEFHEQTTYPEWLNSIYQNERQPFDPKSARTCQDCHMPVKFLGTPLIFRVANIEDNTYPYTDYRAPDKELTLRIRDQYSRHTLVGINEFGMMMFQQFPNILGVRTADYMYAEGVLGMLTALSSSDSLARNETAKMVVTSLRRTDNYLEVAVRVENLAGHSFPSGVAFRRAFISLEVFDAKGKVVWASGRTNSIGAILNGTTDQILPTEFFYDSVTHKQIFQPHHEVISREDQVQIYEELVADTDGKITTSFVGLDHPLKNNRLLPKGWQPTGPFANVTGPHGDAEQDPDYINRAGSSGADTIIYRIPLNERTSGGVAVMAVLNYQSIPPYYLKERFRIGNGAETKRLAYLISHLTVEGTPLENWKLSLVCTMRALGDEASSGCMR